MSYARLRVYRFPIPVSGCGNIASWHEKILELCQEDISVAENDYDNWEAAQPRPLGEVVNMMLG